MHTYFADHVAGVEVDQRIRQLKDGNLNSYVWLTEAIDAVRQRRPGLVTIDSHFSYVGSQNIFGTNTQAPENIVTTVANGVTNYLPAYEVWARLPGDPLLLNDSGRVWAVIGDPLCHRTYFPDPELKELDMNMRIKVGDDDNGLKKALSQRKDETTRYRHGAGINSIEHNSAVVVVSGLLALSSLSQGLEYLNSHKDMSRRKFLGRGAAAVAGVLFAAGRGGGTGHRELTSDERTQIYLQADATNTPGFDWINARNAIYLFKTADAVDRLTQQGNNTNLTAAILVGTAHEIGFKQINGENAKCEEAIHKYTLQLFAVIDQYKKTVDVNFDAQLAKKMLVDQITRIDLVEFGPAERQTAGVPTVLDEIKSRVKSHQSFISPRVVKALAGL